MWHQLFRYRSVLRIRAERTFVSDAVWRAPRGFIRTVDELGCSIVAIGGGGQPGDGFAVIGAKAYSTTAMTA